jgi:hypothetical protein
MKLERRAEVMTSAAGCCYESVIGAPASGIGRTPSPFGVA